MASGYEKAACGVDPRNGWGKPSRRENAILNTIGVLGGVVTVVVYVRVLCIVISGFG